MDFIGFGEYDDGTMDLPDDLPFYISGVIRRGSHYSWVNFYYVRIQQLINCITYVVPFDQIVFIEKKSL